MSNRCVWTSGVCVFSCFWTQRWWKPAPCWYLTSMTSWRTRRTAKARATLHERWERVTDSTDSICVCSTVYSDCCMFFLCMCRWTRLWTLCVALWGTCRMLWSRFLTASLKEWPKCRTTWGVCPRDWARTSNSPYSRQVHYSGYSMLWKLSYRLRRGFGFVNRGLCVSLGKPFTCSSENYGLWKLTVSFLLVSQPQVKF